MLSKADEEQLQRVCGNDETLAEARKLIPLAKTRTKIGSGHNLQGLTTALPAVCAYIASKHLNNNDVALDSARQSSCLNTADFTKALKIVGNVLEAELSPKKRRKEVTYDILHEKYHVGMSFSTFSVFLRQAEQALVQMDGRHKIDAPDYRCALFFWASSVIKVKQLPTLDEFAQDNFVLPKRLTSIVKILNDKCNSLKTKLVEAAKSSSRPSSPTKLSSQPSTPRTPRRSPKKPLRELPTRESVKKQRENPPTETSSPATRESQDVEMESLETPTKKRKLDPPNVTVSPSKRRLPFPPITPSAPHITHSMTPTKSKLTATVTVPSPLRRSARSMLQHEVDDEMDVDEDDLGGDINRSLVADLSKVGEDDEEEDAGEPTVMRRFRPVYQDFRQWYARDAKVLRMWKVAGEGLTKVAA